MKRLIKILTLSVFIIFTFLVTTSNSLATTDWYPVFCFYPQGKVETHNPVLFEPWYPSGEWRVVNFWTNMPGYGQGERKLLLEPGQNPGLLGGGSNWYWYGGCEAQAREAYDSNPLPPVTLAQLEAEGLIYHEGMCTNPYGTQEIHEPNGTNWYPKGDWRAVEVWFPGKGSYEALHKVLLSPTDNVGFVNGGGSNWYWGSNCEAKARENYNKMGAPEVSLSELEANGLIVH